MFSFLAIEEAAQVIEIPMFLHGLFACFPSPADDHVEARIDLAAMLVENAAATFLHRVDGHSMRDAGIYHGDVLIVDRSLQPVSGDIIVAVVFGELSVKRLLIENGRPRLVFENADFPPYLIPEAGEFEIWGVVTANVHWHRGRK